MWILIKKKKERNLNSIKFLSNLSFSAKEVFFYHFFIAHCFCCRALFNAQKKKKDCVYRLKKTVGKSNNRFKLIHMYLLCVFL